ncbi:MAG: serralysin [Candidatus Poribacteria bacterium]|nr:MAG: serralysin [Candidatus Poribacteria bacterium]
MTQEEFLAALQERKEKVYSFLHREEFHARFQPEHIHDAIYSYMKGGGKSLRPAVLLFSCGAVGGEEERAVPAAAAVEIFHTWTLIHDDIIDRDDRRRGGPTVHEEFRQRAISELGYEPEEAIHYGLSIAILAGDMQQGWSVAILATLADYGVDPRLALHLIYDAGMRVLSLLVDGELRDVQFSRWEIEALNEDLVLEMLTKKTGILYEYAGKAGALIGLNTLDESHPYVRAISQFTRLCGTAFQLQDDILGIVGDETALGKPVGSDIREGKRTTIVLHAYRQAQEAQRRFLQSVLGNPAASREEIQETVRLLRELGGIEYTAGLARKFVSEALEHLDQLPESYYRELLRFWAEFMIQREF